MKKYPLKVKKKIFNTEDAITVVFEIPEEHKEVFKYKPGQFITLEIPMDGTNVRRSYSLSSCPELDKDFYISIKKIPQGKLSPYLVDEIKEGQQIYSSKPGGLFWKNKYSDFYSFWAAGSGITPVLSVLKHIFHKNEKAKVLLVYSNRTEDLIIFKEELEKMQKKYPNFELIHVLSREENKEKWKYTGRLDLHLAKEIFRDFTNKHQIKDLNQIESYLCGPEDFMNISRSAMVVSGCDNKHIYQEDFHIKKKKVELKIKKTSPSETSVELGPTRPESKTKIIQMTFNEETKDFKYEKGSILDTLIDSGVDAPHSCTEGNCMACLCKLKKGKVHQKELYILSSENVDKNEFLACQSYPLTEKVEVDFDDLS